MAPAGTATPLAAAADDVAEAAAALAEEPTDEVAEPDVADAMELETDAEADDPDADTAELILALALAAAAELMLPVVDADADATPEVPLEEAAAADEAAATEAEEP